MIVPLVPIRKGPMVSHGLKLSKAGSWRDTWICAATPAAETAYKTVEACVVSCKSNSRILAYLYYIVDSKSTVCAHGGVVAAVDVDQSGTAFQRVAQASGEVV